MLDTKRQTDLIGWVGFALFLCGVAAIGLPGPSSSVWSSAGLVMTGAGAAVILIYLTRKLRSNSRRKAGGSHEL